MSDKEHRVNYALTSEDLEIPIVKRRTDMSEVKPIRCPQCGTYHGLCEHTDAYALLESAVACIRKLSLYVAYNGDDWVQREARDWLREHGEEV